MSVRIEARAKVNLTLEVLGRREDGYHEIASVLQTISLADTLIFEPGDAISLRSDVPDLDFPENLVLRAARLLQDESGTRQGASIQLTKRIPMAAGLGSGATNAAATLVGLDRLWGTSWPAGELAELAADLGSDVPFFLCGGTALASGRGERVAALPPAPEVWIVLLKPDVEVVADKTAHMYAMLSEGCFSAGHHTERLTACLRAGGAMGESLLYNVFEDVAFDFAPDLSGYRSRFLEAGAASVHLAGAGPALFTIVQGGGEGRAVHERLRAQGLESYVARTVSAGLLPPRGSS